MKSSHARIIRMIAVFKFFKTALFLAVGVGAFKLLHKDVAMVIKHLAEAFRLDPANHFIEAALEKGAKLQPAQIRKLGAVSFVYAGLFFTEGIGLWLMKRWAEWLTVVITSSLVPIEIYEIYRHPSPVKVVVLLVNVATVGYLVYGIRSHKSK
jgi:uncharacterized membrane protein (DUF2068 family)